MKEINWGLKAPIRFKGSECSYIYYFKGHGTISYKVTDQKKFAQVRGTSDEDEHINTIMINLLLDYIGNNKIKESDIVKTGTTFEQNVSEYMMNNNSKYSEENGIMIINIKVNDLSFDEQSMKSYEQCLKNKTESNSNVVVESNSNLVPVKDPEPLKEENNMMPLYIGLVIVVVAIVGIIFYKKKNK